MPKDMTNPPADDQAEEQAELLSHPSYEELLQKLDEAERKTTELWERLLRLQAESDNAQRRAERDVANAHKFALEKFIADLLPIVDSLELSITNVAKDARGATQSIMDGTELTLKMFYASLEKFGVKTVNPLNELFDPAFQQAISMQIDPSIAAGTVTSVLQKGYTLNNRLIRPALVVVSKVSE